MTSSRFLHTESTEYTDFFIYQQDLDTKAQNPRITTFACASGMLTLGKPTIAREFTMRASVDSVDFV